MLRTNTPFEARETVLRYNQLWMVEQTFRTAKALLDTRPAFHRTDATIRGHVFCSFLAMVLQKEFFRRMEEAGVEAEWADIVRDLNAVTETQLEYDAKRFVLRSKMQGVAGKIVQCVGVRPPNTIRQVDAPQGGDARSAARSANSRWPRAHATARPPRGGGRKCGARAPSVIPIRLIIMDTSNQTVENESGKKSAARRSMPLMP